jgi:heterodisulfide reductase subunit A-like polyferredoxin
MARLWVTRDSSKSGEPELSTTVEIEQLPAGERLTPDHEVVIVGAGFGGIGARIALQRRGIHDFIIVDQWDRVGGTWQANTYPVVAVDIPSFVYSFS